MSQTPAGTLLLALAEAVAEDLAPVATLALLKHPLVGGEGAERLAWLDAARDLDLALRGPRPRAGLVGLDERIATVEPRLIDRDRAARAWAHLRPRLAAAAQFLQMRPRSPTSPPRCAPPPTRSPDRPRGAGPTAAPPPT